MNVIPEINDMLPGSYTIAVRNVFKSLKSKEEGNMKLEGISFFKGIVGII